MTEEQIKAWRLIENKTAESSYDEAMISKEIEELRKQKHILQGKKEIKSHSVYEQEQEGCQTDRKRQKGCKVMKYKGKEIIVACPSYKRYKVETLSYIPFCKVYVAPEEYEAYLEFNPKHTENIVKCPKGVQGNLCRVRNYILDTEFENGADIVLLIDDDLRAIEHFEMSEDGTYAYEKVKVKSDELLDFLYRYSLLCHDWGFKFWGLNCNSDTMSYRQCSPFSTTSYIGGPFQCFLKGNELRYDERLPLKEDYDMTLQNMNLYLSLIHI